MNKYSVFTDIEAIGSSKSKFENLTERVKKFSPFFLTSVPVDTENKIKKSQFRIWNNKRNKLKQLLMVQN